MVPTAQSQLRSWITQVRFKAAAATETNNHVVGYVTIIINGDLCLKEIKVIQRDDGHRFLAFPSRPTKHHCLICNHSIAIKYNFCPHCGQRQPERLSDHSETIKLHHDVAHPIYSELRQQFERVVLAVISFDEAVRNSLSYRNPYDYPYVVSWRNGLFTLQQSLDRIEFPGLALTA